MAVLLQDPNQISSSAPAENRSFWIWLPSWRVLRYVTLVLVCILYASSFTTRWWWTPDSALYLMLKDNLLAGNGYTLWGFPHIHVPPGFPVFLAGLDWIGLGSDWGRNLFMIGAGLATIWVTYRVLLRVTSEGMALLITAAFAYCHTMHFNTIRLLSDVPCMLFVWLGLWCWLAGLKEGGKRMELGTFFWLIACSMRVAALPLALGASFGLLFQSRDVSRTRTWLNAGVVPVLTATAVAGFVFYRMTLHGALPTYEGNLFRILEWSFADWFRLPMEHAVLTSWSLSEIVTGQPNESLGSAMILIWIPIILGIGACIRRKQTILAFMFLAYCGPIIILRDMLPRYLLPVAPLVLLFFCDGFASYSNGSHQSGDGRRRFPSCWPGWRSAAISPRRWDTGPTSILAKRATGSWSKPTRKSPSSCTRTHKTETAFCRPLFAETYRIEAASPRCRSRIAVTKTPTKNLPTGRTRGSATS